eukprot:CAMPEP_0170640384 /NCGR_PEP_ID=MMETSP0224-20130122/40196_1 /TAXON_ID=285029 /ORGANISM="Togula jolla, Strain CCCM 725" /LENGTH=393 /DNA_ID=CAMNT_0010970887 /DNA_START=12 /DNA_END=1194 /DNA_ORIENTATION=+
MAHLVLVPAWTFAPAMLLACLVMAGRPQGMPGIIACVAMGGGTLSVRTFQARSPFLLAVLGTAATAPTTGQRVVAVCAAGMASFLAWLCKGGKGDFARRPALREFLVRWGSHYYEQAELRGELGSIQKEKSFFAFHPHGCLSAGFTINGCFGADFAKASGRTNWLLDGNLRYKNPLFRAMSDAVANDDRHLESADKLSCQKVMATGENVALIPGGFQDAVAYQFGKDRTVFRRKKGFIKYCLQFGYRLHPVYTFGESTTFYAFTGLQRLRMRLSEYNIPMVLFFGWPLFPILPMTNARIVTYVGKAIDLPHIPTPTPEEVDQWHTKYMESLKELFVAKRTEAGFPDAQLESFSLGANPEEAWISLELGTLRKPGYPFELGTLSKPEYPLTLRL